MESEPDPVTADPPASPGLPTEDETSSLLDTAVQVSNWVLNAIAQEDREPAFLDEAS